MWTILIPLLWAVHASECHAEMSKEAKRNSVRTHMLLLFSLQPSSLTRGLHIETWLRTGAKFSTPETVQLKYNTYSNYFPPLFSVAIWLLAHSNWNLDCEISHFSTLRKCGEKGKEKEKTQYRAHGFSKYTMSFSKTFQKQLPFPHHITLSFRKIQNSSVIINRTPYHLSRTQVSI